MANLETTTAVDPAADPVGADGTLVVVTGGSGGLGAALLAAAPAGAVLVDVSRSGPGRDGVEHVPADLADPASWAPTAAALGRIVARRSWDRIVVIHNAGMLAPIGFAGEVDAELYTTNVLLNAAAGPVFGHHVLAAMRGHRSRRDLVLVSSGAASHPVLGWSAYCAGKAAAEHWVRTVAAEQQVRGGARVLAIGPGVVSTGMQELIRSVDEADFPRVEHFRELHRSGGLAAPDEAARQVWDVIDDPDVTSGACVDVRGR